MLRASSLTLAAVLCVAVVTTARNHAQQPTAAGVPGQAGGRGGGQAAAGGRVPPIDERTAGMQKIDGYFPLYWDERSGTMFLEIPRFDSEFLFSTGLSAGLGSNDIGLDRGQLGACHI